MENLVNKQISLLKERIKNHSIEVEFSGDAIKHLAEIGFDENYGARPLQSTFNRLVIRPLSKKILSGEEELSLKVDMKDNELVIN